jgi:signal transduction histidine kinase
MIAAPVAEFHFEGFRPQGQGNDLVAQADAENGQGAPQPPDQFDHRLHILRVPRAVGEEQPVRREGKDGLYLYCEDTGEGIAKENQDKIFDRFYKVNDFIQGTGLGLAICKAIADASNGAIGVESEGQGTGTTFWIWVPADIKTERRLDN